MSISLSYFFLQTPIFTTSTILYYYSGHKLSMCKVKHKASDLEKEVFLWPEGSNLVCHVIGNDNDVTATRKLWRLQCHSPDHHSNLFKERQSHAMFIKSDFCWPTVICHSFKVEVITETRCFCHSSRFQSLDGAAVLITSYEQEDQMLKQSIFAILTELLQSSSLHNQPSWTFELLHATLQ